MLLQGLIDRAALAEIHSLIARMSADNAVSMALCEKLGFEHVGAMREVGHKFGRWIDVQIYQRMLA